MVTYENLNEVDQELFAICYEKEDGTLHWIQGSDCIEGMGRIYEPKVFYTIEDAAVVYKRVSRLLNTDVNLGTFWKPKYAPKYKNPKIISFTAVDFEIRN